ncbi:MAG: Sec23/Sec24 zinc finger-containing protein [bacterium]
MDNLPPYSNTHCFITETQNSTPRIIRSTLTRLPSEYSVVQSTNLMLGFVMQPFAEFLPQERTIPKVEVPEGIFRCKTCESYINNKYKIDFNKLNKRCATCNLCGSQNELDTTNPKVKPEYFNNNLSVPELLSPTVDFIAPNNMKHTNPFYPHYIFLIDLSKISVEVGLPNYVSTKYNCFEFF